MAQHCCVRVYNNGHKVVEHHADERAWVDHNRTFRPGCALIVDGQVRATGYLGQVRCGQLAHEIQQQEAARKASIPQERVAPTDHAPRP